MIDNNPFAKGFRDGGAGKREIFIKRQQLSDHLLSSNGVPESSSSCSAEIARILSGGANAHEYFLLRHHRQQMSMAKQQQQEQQCEKTKGTKNGGPEEIMNNIVK
jgi:hypothetical protein